MEHFAGMVAAPPPASHSPFPIIFSRYTALLTDFEKAREHGIFTPLPKNTAGKADDPSRVRTIRNRLACLGYIQYDSGMTTLDPFLKHAIRQFQNEADLKDDGWVGEKTWDALQQLVSFETPSDIDAWFDSTTPKAALQRAISLRLYALGLTESQSRTDKSAIASGLHNFAITAETLGLHGEAIPPETCLETISLLFNQDMLVEKMALAPPPVVQQQQLLISSFVTSMAKVELWLAGYDIIPDGYNVKDFLPWTRKRLRIRQQRVTPTGQSLHLKQESQLYQSLTLYWQDHGKSKEECQMMPHHFLSTFPTFFTMVSSAIQSQEVLSETEKETMISAVMENHSAELGTIWEKARSLGGQMWDGIQRVFGWLRNITRQAQNRVVAIGKNISRLVYNQAFTSYNNAFTALQAIPSFLGWMLHKNIKGSHPSHIMMSRDQDMDFRVYINSKGDQKKISDFMQAVEKRSAFFLLTCRIMAVFISTLVSLIRRGSTGWPGLILALLQVSSKLNLLGNLLVQAQQLV